MNAVTNHFKSRLTVLASGLSALAMSIAVAAPALAVPAEIVANQVNLRTAATTNSDIQEKLMAGTTVEVMDGMRGQDGYIWYSVKTDNDNSGWVREDLLSIQSIGGEFQRSHALLVAPVGEGVNVRSGPSKWYNVRFTGSHGEKAVVTNLAQGKDGALWYKVDIHHTNGGWVRSDLVQLLNPTE